MSALLSSNGVVSSPNLSQEGQSYDIIAESNIGAPYSVSDQDLALRSQIETLSEDNKNMRDALHRNNFVLKEKMAEMRDLKEKQEASVARQASQYQSAKATIAGLKAKLEELSAKLMAKTSESEALRGDFATSSQLRSQLENMQSERSQLLYRISLMESVLESQKSVVDVDVKRQLEEMKVEKSEQLSRIIRLESVLEDQTHEVRELRSNLEDKMVEVEELVDANQTLDAEIKERQEQMQEMKEENDHLRKEVSSQREQLVEAMQNLKRRGASSLDHEDSAKKLQEMEEERDNLKAEILQLMEELRQAKSEISVETEALLKRRAAVEDSASSSSSYEAKLQEIMDERDSLRNEVDELRREVSRVDREAGLEKLALLKRRDVMMDSDSPSPSYEETTRKLEEVMEERNGLKSEVVQLKEELSRAGNEIVWKSKFEDLLKKTNEENIKRELERKIAPAFLEEKDVKIAELEKELEHFQLDAEFQKLGIDGQTAFDRAKEDLEESEKRVEELMAELNGQKEMVDELNAQLGEEKRKQAEVKEERKIAPAFLEEKDAKIAELEKELEHFRLDAQLGFAAKEDLEESEKRVEELTAELNGQKEMVDELNAQLGKEKRKQAEVKEERKWGDEERLTGMQREMERLQRNAEGAGDVYRELDTLRDELAIKGDRVRQLERELNAQKDSLLGEMATMEWELKEEAIMRRERDELEVKKLKKEKYLLENDNESLRAEYEKLKMRAVPRPVPRPRDGGKNKKAQELEENNVELKKMVDDLNVQLDANKDAHLRSSNEKDMEVERQHGLLRQMQAELAETRRNRQALDKNWHAEIVKREKAVGLLNEKERDLERMRERWMAEADQLKMQFTALARENRELQTDLTALEDENGEIVAKKEQYAEDLEKLRSHFQREVARLDNDKRRLQEQLQAAYDEIGQQQQNMDRDKANFETAYMKKEDEGKRERREKEKAQRDLEEILRRHTASQQQNDRLSSELRKTREELGARTAEAVSADELAEAKQERVDQLEKENDEMKKQLEHVPILQQQCDVWRQDYDAEREARENTENERQRLFEEVLALRSEVRQLRNEIDRLKDEIEKKEGDKMAELVRRNADHSGRRSVGGGSGWELPRPPTDGYRSYRSFSGGSSRDRPGNMYDEDERMVAEPVFEPHQPKFTCPICGLDFPDHDTCNIHVDECLAK